ncbi:COG4315 family predicted lipoprotein [Streptomyces sp. NPDC002577]
MRARTALIAVPLLALGLAACGGGNDAGGTAKGSGSDGKATAVSVANSGLGSILVDGQGRTLYAFTKDKAGTSNCDAKCIAVWPALTSASKASAGQGAKSSLIKEAKKSGGAVQVRYGDWPLYYYVGDAAPGDVNGQGLDGQWFVVGADGKLIRKGA